MANMSLFIDELRSNVNARILIASDKWGVEAFVTQGFSVGGGNEFNSLFELAAQESLNNLLSKIGFVVGQFNKKMGGIIAQTRLKDLRNTTASWISSAKPSFSLALLFVATDPSHDVRDNVAKLLECVYPVAGNGFTVKPPLGYTGLDSGGNSAEGTISLEIGKWFRAMKLVMKSCNFEFSKAVIGSGVPLYAHGTVELEAYRQVTAKDMNNWFI